MAVSNQRSLAGLVGLQAWVWTASALPKVTSATFLNGFVHFVRSAPPTRPAVYTHLVAPIVLAAPGLFAVGAMATEVTLAAIFIGVTLALWRRAGSPALLAVTAIASLVGAGFALNLALLVGDAAPWTLGDPFDAGVALEYLLVGLALVTAATALSALRTPARHGRPVIAVGRGHARQEL